MGTFVPTEGEVLDFEAVSLNDLFENLEKLSGSNALFIPQKVSSGAVWWMHPDKTLPDNDRAKKWMDISERVFGPAAYLSPREVRRLGLKGAFDGEPMVKINGNIFPVRKKINGLGGIRHAEDNQWWVPMGLTDLAYEIIKKGIP